MGKKFVLTICSLFLLAGCAVLTPEPTATVQASDTPRPANATLQAVETATPTSEFTPTITLTPTITPVPVSTDVWLVKAIEVEGNYFLRASWVDEATLRFTSKDWQDIYYNVNGEIIARPAEMFYTPTVSSIYSAYDSFISISPNHRYVLSCTKDELTLYEHESGNEIGHFLTEIEDCEIFVDHWVSWYQDEALAMKLSHAEAYIWETDGHDPLSIGISAYPPMWGLNGDILLIFPALDSFLLVFRDGRSLPETSKGWVEVPASPQWITDRIIVNEGQCGAGCSFRAYLDVYTGEEVFSYFTNLFSAVYRLDLQKAIWSEDARWVVVDGRDFGSGDYYLLDIESRERYSLGVWTEVYYEFIGWSETRQGFYLLSKPSYLFQQLTPPPSRPTYGLLLLNPWTRTFRTVVEDAIYIDHDMEEVENLFLLNRQMQPDGTYAVEAAIYDWAGKPISAKALISDHMLEPDLELGDPTAWKMSRQGDKFVLADWQGDIWVMDVEDGLTQIAEAVSIMNWPYAPRFQWSPDDKHILVELNERAWVVEVPE